MPVSGAKVTTCSRRGWASSVPDQRRGAALGPVTISIATWRGPGARSWRHSSRAGNTASWAFGYTLLLAPASLLPWVAGWLGAIYGVSAALAGGWLLQHAARFRWSPQRDESARSLFLATLLYLPCVMGALLLDQLLGR